MTGAVISTAEVIRAFTFLNVLFGIWLLIAPWALVGASAAGRWSDMICGVALILLTLPRGTVRDRYAGWAAFVV